MKVLSIQEPWASLILYHGKDVENRKYKTSIRGDILIHPPRQDDDFQNPAGYRKRGLARELFLLLYSCF